MCYEFSLWSRKRRQDQVSKEPQKAEQVAKQPKPMQPVQPVAVDTKVEEREKIPA